MDKEAANPDRVMQELTEHGLVSEAWGGDTIFVPISAKNGEGIDSLLEMILLVSEVEEYKANPARKANGTVIEARLDKGRGSVATLLVQNGTLKIGDRLLSVIHSDVFVRWSTILDAVLRMQVLQHRLKSLD